MAELKRSSDSGTTNKGVGPGPFLAKVISHLDRTKSGDIQVSLLRSQANSIADDNQTFTVKYASPFLGYTSADFVGHNNNDFNDAQKSYGFWMIPPDVGVTVIVIFIDGKADQGYWLGCVPTRYSNNMIPAIGGTTTVDLKDDDKKKFSTKQPLPVAEANKRSNTDKVADVDKQKKAVHPIADHFLEQGTLEDDVRGTTTTTSRREVPSAVYGISTPGPLDRRAGAKKGKIGKQQSSALVPVSRLGGTQFVMDDGDDRYIRKKSAKEGPVEYSDVLKGEKGQSDIPYNEYVRLRTRTGHQILMHNSEDLIYISNARGTAWIELTANGKIDIYAEDSISIHSQNDLNIRADRDINLEAGRNINMKATAQYQSPSKRYEKSAEKDAAGTESGRIQIESANNTNILIGKNGKITLKGNLDTNAGGHIWETSGGTNETKAGGDIVETGPNIHMNGPAANPALKVSALETRQNVITDGTLEWSKTKYQGTTPLDSIMRRIPMHEPWPLHENMAPQVVVPKFTDREN